MAVLDIIILAVAILAIVYGLAKGIITQIGSLVGVIVGVLACRVFADNCTNLIVGDNPSETSLYVTAVIVNIVIFAIGFIATKLVAKLIKTVAHALMLSLIDRIAGAIFSLFASMLILSFALNVWQMMTPEKSLSQYSKTADGKLVEAVIKLAPTVLGSEPVLQLLNSTPSHPQSE